MNRLLYLIGYSQKVAFTAGIHSPGNTGKGRTLVFPVFLNNEGGGYHPSSGVFVDPKDGQYVFFVSAKDSTVTLST